MTNPSITPSGALDKHIRLYDYHSDTLLLCVCMLCSWVLLLIVVALIFDMRRAMIVGSILCPPMFGAYVLSRRTHLEITEDGLRYVGVLKRISVPWNQVRSVSEVWRTWQGYRRCRPYAIVLTDAGKFRVQASLESADAPTFKSYSTGGPTPCCSACGLSVGISTKLVMERARGAGPMSLDIEEQGHIFTAC